MSGIEILGLVAAFLTSLSFLPQAVLVIRTRNTDGISPLMYGMFVTGVALWVSYGVMIGSWPIIIANVITFVFSFLIFLMTLRNMKRR